MTPDDDALRDTVAPATAGTGVRPDRFVAGAIVASRYRIVAPLGAGGMGEVYRADDLRLGHPVALKFLPAIQGDDRRDLLISEVRIGRQVSHPNVCRLYDLVEDEGSLFIAMEFVEGEDLANLLRKAGRLSPDRALRIVRDIAAGLAAAHDLGVIHRDLKPANVMIDPRGLARIADFGLAVLRGESRGGELAGTPGYMAPEQLAGEPATPRSDLYALGVIALEMLTGTRLYDAPTLEGIARQHRERKTRPSDLVPGVDPQFEQVVLSLVEEDAAVRPPSSRELLRALPAETGAAAAGPGRDSSAGSSQSARSIAVLPFESLTTGPDDEVFAIGLAEEILSDLTRIRSLRVTSRSSAMRFRGARDLPATARELQVRYLLTGSVQSRGTQLRVTANLVDAATDSIVWSDKVTGATTELFDIQEKVARAVATQLKGQLSAEESREIGARLIPNPLAFEYYLKARSEVWRFTKEGLDRALEHLRRGTELVGDNVLFAAATANVHWQYYNGGLSSDVRHLEKAAELGRQVLALDPGSPHGPRILGLVAMSRADVRGAVVHLRRAVALDPNDTETLGWSCALYSFAGLSDLALPLLRRLREIDPTGSLGYMGQCMVQVMQGRWVEGAASAARGSELDPGNAMFTWALAYALVLDRRTDEARRVIAACERDHPEAFFTKLLQLLIRAIDGDRDGVTALLTPEFHTAAWNDLQYSANVAEAWALLGERGRSLEWLANAIARGYNDTAFLGSHDWLFESVRSEPRFDELLADARQRSEALRAEVTAPASDAV